MKSKVIKNRAKDIIMTVVLTLLLTLIFYLLPTSNFNWFNLTLLLLLLIPTIMTLVNGAPFVPTPMNAVKKMLKIANPQAGQKVYDIGCGDGRMVYLAANKYKTNAIGLELSPLVFALAKIRKLLWRSKAKILFRNFKRYDLSDADYIFCYLMPETLSLLIPKLQNDLHPGAKIVSYAFKIKEWVPSYVEEEEKSTGISPIYVYEKQ